MASVPASASPPPELKAAVTYLSKVDGVDKLAKIAMNLAKVVASGDGERAGELNNLATTLAEGRAMMRMGQWVKSTVNLQESLNTMARAGKVQKAGDIVKVVRHASDLGYKMGDNVSFLSKKQVIDADTKQWALAAKRMQITMFTLDALLGCMALGGVGGQTVKPGQEGRVAGNVVRAVLDCLMVLPNTKLIDSYAATVPDWFPAACGAASGGIAASFLISDSLKDAKKEK